MKSHSRRNGRVSHIPGPTFHFAEFMQFNPFRSPSWRWERASELVNRQGASSLEMDDEPTRKSVAFLQALEAFVAAAQSRSLPAWMRPLHDALQLYERGGNQRLLVEAWLLAGQSIAAVAEACGLEPETVAWYEALFYNVTDRLQARDWILLSVIGKRPIPDTPPDRGQILKLLAYHGGPLLLEAVAGHLLGDPLATARDPVMARCIDFFIRVLNWQPTTAEPAKHMPVAIEQFVKLATAAKKARAAEAKAEAEAEAKAV